MSSTQRFTPFTSDNQRWRSKIKAVNNYDMKQTLIRKVANII